MIISLFQIKSGSMMPEIEIGEIAILLKQNEYEKDDIITYQVNDLYFITHRIKEVKENGYITKGDFNNDEDEELIVNNQIRGKVIFHSKILGKIYKYKSYIIIILLLFLILAILM